MITHVPMAVHPRVKNVLVIGGGDGGTVRELVKYRSIESIDLVEVDKHVVLLAKKYLPFTSSKLRDSSVLPPHPLRETGKDRHVSMWVLWLELSWSQTIPLDPVCVTGWLCVRRSL